MKILLTTLNAKYIHTNLAIRLLYAQNHRDHPGLEWREFTIKQDADDVAAQCADYEIIAFSCYIWNITQTLDVAARIKALNPAVKILLGGPEVSYDWQDVIEHEQVDYIITGEGEIPFQRFLLSYPYVSEVPNLVWKEAIVHDALAPNAGFSASLPSYEAKYAPQALTFDLENYRDVNPYAFDPPEDLASKIAYIETSRGCPYKCEFCLASLDNKVRYLPNETIKKQLLFVMQHGRVVKFLDRTFNVKRDFSLDIFQYILTHHRPGNVFQFEITADILHPDLILFIRENVPNGLFRFEIGIQSVNRDVNLAVSRKQSFEKTKGVVLALQDKIEMHLDLIVGLPLEYWDDVKFSFESVFALHPPELQLGFLKFLKGTPMRYKYEQHGYVFDPNPPYQIIESQYLSQRELVLIEQVEHMLEIFWNKNRAPFALKYVSARYSIFDFLQALGEYWSQRHDFHKYTLHNVFDTLRDFVLEHFPEDTTLHELVHVDYHLYHKICPKPLFDQAVEKGKKNWVLANTDFDVQKYRCAVLSLGFDFEALAHENRLEMLASDLVLAYDGKNQALWQVVRRFSEVESV